MLKEWSGLQGTFVVTDKGHRRRIRIGETQSCGCGMKLSPRNPKGRERKYNVGDRITTLRFLDSSLIKDTNVCATTKGAAIEEYSVLWTSSLLVASVATEVKCLSEHT